MQLEPFIEISYESILLEKNTVLYFKTLHCEYILKIIVIKVYVFGIFVYKKIFKVLFIKEIFHIQSLIMTRKNTIERQKYEVMVNVIIIINPIF